MLQHFYGRKALSDSCGRLHVAVWILLLTGLAPSAAWGHGGVFLEDDLCVIQIGFYKAHFTIFQPRANEHEQFCEDLPHAAETVFVLEYLHDGLESMPLDFRIVRNVTRLGEFARWEDVLAIADLDAATVFYQPAVIEPVVFTTLHDFTERGEYIGIITSTHPSTGEFYSAVFPFRVGSLVATPPLVVAAVLVVSGTLAWLLWGRRRRPAEVARSVAIAVVSTTLLLAQTGADAAETDRPFGSGSFISDNGDYRLTVVQPVEAVPINHMHSWKVRLTTADGKPADGAVLRITGAMPEHDHGLPSAPLATRLPEEGDFLLEGMKFHMNGYWEVEIEVSRQGVSDRVVVPFVI